jgi:hypothetical protein
VLPGRLTARQLGDAEVEDLDPSVGADHDVAGFEVAVGDAALVGGAQGVGDRNRDFQELPRREPVLGDQLR